MSETASMCNMGWVVNGSVCDIFGVNLKILYPIIYLGRFLPLFHYYMYRRSHEIRPSEHGVSPAGSIINIFGIKEVVGEAKRAPLLKKYSMCESALGDREGSQTPLAFSARAVSKRKSSFLAEYVETPNKVKLSRYGNAPHLESEES